MALHTIRMNIGHQPGRPSLPPPGPLTRVVTWALATILFAALFAASLVVLAIGFMAGLLGWGYLLWKTRALRRQRRSFPDEGPASPSVGGRIIEGQVTRD